MRSGLILTAIVAFGLGGQTCSADPITYNFVNYSTLESGYTLSGTITTDGNIGTIGNGDIKSWTFTVTDGETTYTVSSTDAGASKGLDSGSVQASATALTMAVPASGVQNSLDLHANGEPTLQYVRANNYAGFDTEDAFAFDDASYNTVWQNQTPGSNGLTLGTNAVWTIATATPSAVPEPSSLVMCGLGGVGVALAAWRRRRAATA
jgi:hypothetical protein